MPLPPGLATVTVTGTYTHPDGTPFTGRVLFRPEPAVLTSSAHDRIILGEVVAEPDATGSISVVLLATDDPDVTPSGWTYRVTERWYDQPGRTYPLALPLAAPTVDLADVAPTAPAEGEYTVVTGPEGPAGPQGEPGPAGVDGETRPGVTHPTEGLPADTLGVDGDWALDTGARRLYGPKSGATWPAFSVVPPPTEPGWSRNGLAALTGSDLYLTHAGGGFGAGSSWYSVVQPTDGLDVMFECEMSGGSGADGVCFALADPATLATFVGGGGGDLGLIGADAVALALDTGAGSRARLVTTDASSMTTLVTYGGPLTLRPDPVSVRVRYAGGQFQAWINGVQAIDAAVAVTTTARIGWTGSNGGLDDDHIVRAVQFTARGGIQL